jgi:ABC-type Zn uptake system ZnuABC Zn-binding protein ZnuA
LKIAGNFEFNTLSEKQLNSIEIKINENNLKKLFVSANSSSRCVLVAQESFSNLIIYIFGIKTMPKKRRSVQRQTVNREDIYLGVF